MAPKYPEQGNNEILINYMTDTMLGEKCRTILWLKDVMVVFVFYNLVKS